MKKCTGCEIEKPDTEFFKDSNNPNRLRTYCKQCVRDDNNLRAKRKKKIRFFWKREIKNQTKVKSNLSVLEKRKNYALNKRYGIDINQYNELLKKQNGVCAVCGNPPGKRSLHVDHSHKTGAVRSLLCSNCNTALGKVEDNIGLLKSLIKYLQKYTQTA